VTVEGSLPDLRTPMKKASDPYPARGRGLRRSDP